MALAALVAWSAGQKSRSVVLRINLPDTLMRQSDWHPQDPVNFQVSASDKTSIFVLTTGIQVKKERGWETQNEIWCGEIWRLETGKTQTLGLKPPQSGEWRAFLKYGSEVNGPQKLAWQMREALKLHSFSNWTGKAWGGGRYRGTFQLFSQEIGSDL